MEAGELEAAATGRGSGERRASTGVLAAWGAGWAAAAGVGLAGYLAFGVAGLAVLPAGTSLPAGLGVAFVPIVGAFALTLPGLLVVHQGVGSSRGAEAVAAGQVDLVAAGGRLALGLCPVLALLGTAGGTTASRVFGSLTLALLGGLVLAASIVRRVDEDRPEESARAWPIGLAHAGLLALVACVLYAQVVG